jgi:outer membrane protein assembly factor BamA
MEDAGGSIGVTDDQLFLGYAYMSFTDYLGDRRLNVLLSSVDTFSDFDIQYIDASDRHQWSVRLYDERDYYTFQDANIIEGRLIERQEAFRQTGVSASLIYPFSFYTRAETGLGYLRRKFFLPVPNEENPPIPGIPAEPENFNFLEFEDDIPYVFAALTGDTSISTSSGPISGQRWRLRTTYGVDTEESGTLTWNTELDYRAYLPLTRRSNFALRFFAGYADGNRPSFYYVGGLDTIRGVNYRSLQGDRVFFGNIEFRFPLIDAFVTPILDFRGIRGRIFLDVGGVWFSEFQDFDFMNEETDKLVNGIAAYGYGLTVRFSGLDLNWDVSKRWRPALEELEDWQTSFWIGGRF